MVFSLVKGQLNGFSELCVNKWELPIKI